MFARRKRRRSLRDDPVAQLIAHELRRLTHGTSSLDTRSSWTQCISLKCNDHSLTIGDLPKISRKNGAVKRLAASRNQAVMQFDDDSFHSWQPILPTGGKESFFRSPDIEFQKVH